MMPTITKITTQTKRTDRYNIFIDEKYSFSVDEDVLLKFQLKKGKEIDSKIVYRCFRRLIVPHAL